MTTTRRDFGVAVLAVLLAVGCADEASRANTTATVSPSVALGAPPVVQAMPEGDGVVLRWEGAPDVAQRVISRDLGAVARSTVGPEGAVTLTRDHGVEERWRSVPEGAEQTWRFVERPASGRVTVGVTFSGATFDHAGDDGLHLRAPGDVAIRYSHATWVGADGARTAVPARWEGGRIALEVPPSVVAQTVFPAVLDPTVTLSFALSATQPEGRVLFGVPATVPEVVQTGSSILLLHAGRVRGTGAGMLTVRAIDESGVYVPGSLRGVPASAFMAFSPAMRPGWAASYGSGAMVFMMLPAGIVAARLAPDGRSLDATPTLVETPSVAPRSMMVGGVACTATTCLVAYSLDGRVLARRVGTDGRLLDATALVLGTTGGEFSRQSVVALGDRFVVGWSTTLPGASRDIRVSRVTAAGAVLDPEGRPVTTAGGERYDLSVATDGARVFLKWFATASGARPTGGYTQLFDADMTALSPLGVHVDLTESLSTWWDGSQYLLANLRRLVRFDAAGARLDATPRTVVSSGSNPWLGPLRGGFLMSEPEGIWRFDSNGARVGGSRPFALSYAEPAGPSTDFEGTTFLAGWAMGSRGAVTRLDLSGNRLDGSGVELGFGVSSVGLHGASAEVFGGTNRATVNLPERTVGPTTMLTSATDRIVRGGAQRLLLQGGCARRLGPDWQTLDPAPVCFTPASRLTADFDGASFRFVYALPALYTRRMNADGDLVEFAPLALPSLGEAAQATGDDPAAYATPSIAFGAGTHMLVWVGPGGVSGLVRAARLAVDGTPGPVITVSSEGIASLSGRLLARARPAVVFDGVNFVVAWVPRQDEQVNAARVSPAGVLLDATPFVFNLGAGPRVGYGERFSMASDQRGSTLLVYNSVSLETAGDQMRGAFLREDGVLVPDAGVTPLDVPAPVDVGLPPMDVPVLVDAGGPVDVSTAIDGATSDTGPDATTADVGTDAGGTDVVIATDVPSVSDVPPVSDVSPVTDVGVDEGPPVEDDGGCSVGAGPSRRTPGWAFALGALTLLGGLRRRRRPIAVTASRRCERG